ncbi:unnamed protein product [Caenorhabditis angaria]|uniref:Asparaginase n=1 Tax=Caenorhabditis angaria TaxID=860376 RepID=A0A9P1IFB5_9PELO|nr:unnamed protein product [Caenorhabditis angaria]
MIIAVHGGASIKKNNEMLEVLELSANSNNVIEAIEVLEDHESFNCGYGSNLNLEGGVENEASYMNDKNQYGAVGCVRNSKNPAKIAEKIAKSTWWRNRKLLHPMLIVGDGVNRFFDEENVEKSSQESLKSPKSIENFEKLEKEQNLSYDTVGAILWSSELCEASSSSGGIILKNPGRLGHSCVYGAGTWAETRKDAENFRKKKCGEIARRLLNPSDDLPIQKLTEFFAEIRGIFGGIAICSEQSGEHQELLIFHNSPYLPVAFRGKNGKIRKFWSKFEGKIGEFMIKSIVL